MAVRDQALEKIRVWANRAKLHAALDVFVFGSLINGDGGAFNAKSSDVDFVLALREQEDFLSRSKRVQAISAKTETLELELLKLFGRQNAGEAIASFVVIEPTERENAIHKGNDGALLSMDRFVRVEKSVVNLTKRARVSQYNTDPQFEALNKERLDAMRMAQGIRNSFLRQALNGTRKLGDHDADEPIPKEIMRRAAMVRWAEKSHPSSEREDLDVGLEYLHQAVRTMGGEDPAIVDLRAKITARRKGRSQSRALTATDQLILGELLFDLARSNLKLSTSLILHSISLDKQNTNQ